MWFMPAYLKKGVRMREFKVVIGAKGYFYEKIKGMDKAKSFLEMVRLSDAYHYEHALFQENIKLIC